MRNIMVNGSKRAPLEKQPIEIVERKGVGHPDSMCDAIMDQVSVGLSKAYLQKFGTILHHNADKSLLVAGNVECRFGGGVVNDPMLLIFGDRATFEFNGESIPVEEIAIQTAKDWLKENLRFVDPDEHMRYQVELKPGSQGLTDIFKRETCMLGANDTSAAVGYAPMTRTETMVLETERYVNSKDFKKRFPEAGEDVKVMGYRNGDGLDLTVAMAFVDRFVDGEKDYMSKKADIQADVQEFANAKGVFDRVNVYVNTLDVEGRGVDGLFLTVLGTCADGADSGQVGRGNKVNGVISLNRPIGTEAAAGKNPVSHVGKIYNALSHQIARSVCELVPEVEEAYVWLLSNIGKPIDQPAIAAAQVVMVDGASLDKKVQDRITEVIDGELAQIENFCKQLIQGKISVW
ncbi:MAG TPA: methionine adenosyltransferase [Candidatus Bathyarchaeota archaeon]|nr:methionine adenosyltransferase [Candidatus Bathyarchaeota archaeon]